LTGPPVAPCSSSAIRTGQKLGQKAKTSAPAAMKASETPMIARFHGIASMSQPPGAWLTTLAAPPIPNTSPMSPGDQPCEAR
jgi:hypothetical protein